MELTIYIETNFLIGLAKGQDPAATELLSDELSHFALVLPSICCMEAFTVWERERKQRNQFGDSLSFQIREISRDITSPRAESLAKLLDESKIESERHFGEMKVRLDETIELLSLNAQLIDLSHDIIHDSLHNDFLADPTDNLILWSILWHARQQPPGAKAFLSRNHNDFEKPRVVEALNASGVKYFRRTEAALGWLRSQRAP